MTVLTDYGLSAVAGVLAAKLWTRAEGQAARRSWAASFAAVALAAVAGGTSHGWAPRLLPSSLSALWLVTYGLVGLGNFLILAGAAIAATRGGVRTGLLLALVLRFTVWFAFIVGRPDFRYVVYDYACTLLGLLVLAACLARWGRQGAGWIVAGVAVSLFGAVIQRGRLAPSPAFNHNDLFHVVQAVGLYLYFRAGLLLTDASRAR